MTDLTTRIAVAIHGATPPDPDAALALHRDAAERVRAALGDEGESATSLAEQWERDDADHMARFGHHLPVSLGGMAALLRDALATAEEPGA